VWVAGFEGVQCVVRIVVKCSEVRCRKAVTPDDDDVEPETVKKLHHTKQTKDKHKTVAPSLDLPPPPKPLFIKGKPFPRKPALKRISKRKFSTYAQINHQHSSNPTEHRESVSDRPNHDAGFNRSFPDSHSAEGDHNPDLQSPLLCDPPTDGGHGGSFPDTHSVSTSHSLVIPNAIASSAPTVDEIQTPMNPSDVVTPPPTKDGLQPGSPNPSTPLRLARVVSSVSPRQRLLNSTHRHIVSGML